MAALRDDWQPRVTLKKAKPKAKKDPEEPVGWREFLKGRYPNADLDSFRRFWDLPDEVRQEVLKR